ncbi:MAG: hypothetical protein LWW87_01490 [Geobacteraceae bacterium]|nr:hypothetical protein [Geobacteraceae bacterium]
MIRIVTVALMALVFMAPTSKAATINIKYLDGTSQKIKLNEPPSQISQINISNDGFSASREGVIRVVAGSYGLNCGTSHGNKTEHLAQQCNGKKRCEYKINYQVIGDPAVGCGKEYVAEWQCGDGELKSTKANAEAGFGSVITLSCQ